MGCSMVELYIKQGKEEFTDGPAISPRPRPLRLASQARSSAHVTEAAVDAEQGELLRPAQLRVRQNGGLRVPGAWRRAVGAVFAGGTPTQQARLGEQQIERHTECGRDRMKHPYRRLVQAPLDLAQVGVRDLRTLGELSERQPRHRPLTADERAKSRHLAPPRILAHLLLPLSNSSSNIAETAMGGLCQPGLPPLRRGRATRAGPRPNTCRLSEPYREQRVRL